MCDRNIHNSVFPRCLKHVSCARFDWTKIRWQTSPPDPRARLKTRGSGAFEVAGPTLWNHLPVYIRMASTLSEFKSYLKTYLWRVGRGREPWERSEAGGVIGNERHLHHSPVSSPTALGPAPLATYPHRPSQAGGYPRDCALLPPSPLSRGEPVRAAAAYLGVRTDEAREKETEG